MLGNVLLPSYIQIVSRRRDSQRREFLPFHPPLTMVWILLGLMSAFGADAAAPVHWVSEGQHRFQALEVPPGRSAGFTLQSNASLGIPFTNALSLSRSLTNQILLNGSGVAAGDVDGDGWVDLYFCGLDTPNALYRNLGQWCFEDWTREAGVGCEDQASTGAVFADVDGDGDLDLLVNGVARGTRLFLNDGHGHFQETTDAAGLRGNTGSTSMALADVDGDGLLDLFVVNYRNDTMRDMPDLHFSVGVTNGTRQLLTVEGQSADAPQWKGRFTLTANGGVLENGQPSVLYHNEGNGRFSPVSWTQGAFVDEKGNPVEVPYDWGLSAMFHDIDGDGVPDLYVCNDFQSPDRIWINDGAGQFHALANASLRQTSLFSMGVDFADVDRDGWDDFFVADMLSPDHRRRLIQVMDPMAFSQARNPTDPRPQFSRNTLFHNRGHGSFAEIARFAGVEATDWSWSPVFLDVDLDGYEDLLITTGHFRDAMDADASLKQQMGKNRPGRTLRDELQSRAELPRLMTPNVALRNRGDLTFESIGAEWGFDSTRISQGMALADLDNDGDLDVVVNCLGEAPLIYRNESSKPRIGVRLKGASPNTFGIGARIELEASGAIPNQSQEMMSGGRYLSSDDPMRVFAAAPESGGMTLRVRWRNGRESVLTHCQANRVYEVDESTSTLARSSRSRAEGTPLFQDSSLVLSHQHQDAPVSQSALQPMLPRSLTELGPGVCWFDFNGDGWEDLFIGTGKGGKLAVYRNDTHGGFVRQKAKAFESPLGSDLTSVLAWRSDVTHSSLILGMANDESVATPAAGVRIFSMATGMADDSLLTQSSSVGPMAMADLDLDGDLDLVVGMRYTAGRYPESTHAYVFLQEQGRWVLSESWSAALRSVGMVTSALLADLDEDGRSELVLTLEWGAIRVFRNAKDHFEPWDVRLVGAGTNSAFTGMTHLGDATGWWNSVACGDLDGDGRLDLVVGNWGRNHEQARYATSGVELIYTEAPDGGGILPLEAHVDPVLKRRVPVRDWASVGTVFPMVKERFASFAAFAEASVDEVLASGIPATKRVTARCFDSAVLLNRPDGFELRSLPVVAQYAPVFGLGVADLDGDGFEDVVGAQNFFGVSLLDSRQDGGCGFVLLGGTNGVLRPLAPHESGLSVLGEGRGLALCDYDHDGRMDIVIAQNRGNTRLFQNKTAKPSLRVRLTGASGNLQAVGARIRAVYANQTLGPSHSIQLGSGYWSQSGADILCGRKQDIRAIQIRWPNGVEERVPVDGTSQSLLERKAP